MPASLTSVEHWNRVYGSASTTVVPDDDPVGVAALAHFGPVDGARVLDLGCGNGEYSLFFAAHGATVTAIDQSPVAVSSLAELCTAQGITTVSPRVAAALTVDELGPFDFVFGSLILHHIEPFTEMVGVLHHALDIGGKAFFYENSAMSKGLVWCRNHLVGRFGIPKNSDDDEFPLEPQEIDALRVAFDVEVEYPTLYLTRLASGYLLKGHGERPLEWVDGQLYRFERLRRLSYRQYVKLTKPLVL